MARQLQLLEEAKELAPAFFEMIFDLAVWLLAESEKF